MTEPTAIERAKTRQGWAATPGLRAEYAWRSMYAEDVAGLLAHIGLLEQTVVAARETNAVVGAILRDAPV